MRKIMIALACVTSFVVSGCTKSPDGSTTVIDPVKIQQVQTLVDQICRVSVAAQTAADVLATFTSYGSVVQLVETAANGICHALASKSARKGGRLPTYRGVVIRLNN